MDGSQEFSSSLRDIFHRWDCGYIETDRVCDEIIALGLCVPPAFRGLLHQRCKTRNLSFAMFMRALKVRYPTEAVADERVADHKVTDSQRLLHVLTLKDIPLAPSAKAPFGTDNNMYIRGVNLRKDSDPVISAAIKSILPGPQRGPAPVPGACNAFEESCADENESVLSESVSELPPHLKPSMHTVSNEPSDADYADFSYHRSSCSSRRMSESSSHLFDGFVAAEDDARSSTSNRRHFGSFHPKTDILEWIDEPVKPSAKAMANAENFRASNILAHQPELPPLAYRPSSRMVYLESTCPFATDADDLSQLRVDLLRKPLGKIPPPTHAT